LASAPSRESILAFHPSEQLSERLGFLLNANKEGMLSRDENAELDEFLRMNHLLKIVRLKAQRLITA